MSTKLAVRKNVSTLTWAERERFIAAVLELKRRGVYDEYVKQHLAHSAHGHRGPGFLPWHREFLRRFELSLQGIDPTVTVPYWDWTVDGKSSSLWDPDFMGGDGRAGDAKVIDGPFAYDAGNWVCVDDPERSGDQSYLMRELGDRDPLPTVASVTKCLMVTPYDHEPWDETSDPSFRNQLEGWPRGLHNAVHRWVGGSMMPQTSPNDPVFFLHHCNVDRLWAEWQRLHPSEPFVPTSGAGHGHNLNDSLHPWGGGTTIASTLDHHALGYRYDTESDPDLLFYDATAGYGEFYTNIGRGRLTFLRADSTWRQSWSHIIPGNFGGGGFTDLLFYDASAGRGVFYRTDGQGNLDRLRVHRGWRSSWTLIVPGDFGGSGFTDVLFYDGSAGHGAFHRTDGLGNTTLLQRYSGWRKIWTHIIPGTFGGSGFTDLLFYSPQFRRGEFYTVNGAGVIDNLYYYDGWRPNWTHIVPGNFGGNGFTDLLFYDPTTGEGELYTTDGRGVMRLLHLNKGWRRSWTHIIPGNFGGDGFTDLLFYDDSTGHGEFYSTDGQGNLALIYRDCGWRTSWNQIIPGNFAVSS